MFEDRNKVFFLVLALFFVTNLLIGSAVELSFDEAYYWMYSEHLNWGYYDHPPMMAVFIKLGTLLFGQTELAVRFFFNVFMCGAVYLIWIMLERKHLLFMWLSVLSMPLIHFSGILALPDTPLLFFGTLYFYSLKKYLESDNAQNIFLLSFTIALLFYSKYHGLLIVLLTILANPSFLKQKKFYLVAILVFLFFAPHMWWQYKHDFISLKFHLTGRVEKHFDIKNILDYIGGQIGLLGIFNFFIFLKIFVKNKFVDKFERILVFNTFGFLLFLFFMSFRNQIEANWTITCCVAFILLFAGKISQTYARVYSLFAIFPIFIGVMFKVALIKADWVVDHFEIKDNRLNEIVRWKEQKIPQILSSCGERRIVGDNYQVTAKLSFYLKKQIAALHLNSRESQYSILKLQKSIPRDEEICFLSSKAKVPSVRIETYYKDPVYVASSITLDELAQANDTTYEKITGN